MRERALVKRKMKRLEGRGTGLLETVLGDIDEVAEEYLKRMRLQLHGPKRDLRGARNEML
jgi:hypothetical protein